MSDRRQPTTRSLRGGRRATDPPPLSTRECADIIGVSTTYIRTIIEAGELKAERLARPGRRTLYRIHEADFVAWLEAVKWSQIPSQLRRTGTA